MSRDGTAQRLGAAAGPGAHLAHRGLTIWSVAIGVAGALVGVVVGGIVGANVGGNWMTGVSIGALHGYEATSMVGAVLGSTALGVLSFRLALRRRG